MHNQLLWVLSIETNREFFISDGYVCNHEYGLIVIRDRVLADTGWGGTVGKSKACDLHSMYDIATGACELCTVLC